MRAYRIDDYVSENNDRHFITKFGGQPDWIDIPQWPVSKAWDDRPLKFIGQIRLDEFCCGYESLTLAYIFLTQPKDSDDDFFDPDIIFADSGENAVIIQPNGSVPEYVQISEIHTGPTVDSENIWIPQISVVEEDMAADFKDLGMDKICGVPALLQSSEIDSDSSLLLQLHTNWLPFYINTGGTPTMFAFLNVNINDGYIIIEDN